MNTPAPDTDLGSLYPLPVYQEVLILALRPDRGTAPAGVWTNIGVGGGMLADLALNDRISLEGKRKKVAITDRSPMVDPLLGAALQRITVKGRRLSAQNWVAKLGTRKSFHAAGERMCELAVLRPGKVRVLGLFPRRAFIEVDPEPRREILERVEAAAFDDSADPDPRTIALTVIAQSIGALRQHFDKRSLRARKKHFKALAERNEIAKATAAAVQVAQAAAAAG